MNKRVIRGVIVTIYGSQCVASKEMKIPEWRLSRLLNGHDQPTPEEAKIFEERLGVRLSTPEAQAG